MARLVHRGLDGLECTIHQLFTDCKHKRGGVWKRGRIWAGDRRSSAGTFTGQEGMTVMGGSAFSLYDALRYSPSRDMEHIWST